jgi:hypothetical protein
MPLCTSLENDTRRYKLRSQGPRRAIISAASASAIAMPAAAWRGFMLHDSIRWGAPGRSLSCAEHYVMAMCKEARSQTLLRAYGEIHAR